MYGRRLADERNNWSIIPPGATFPNVVAQHVKPSEISVSKYHVISMQLVEAAFL